MTVDGMPGLEGYYFDYGRPLEGGRARALRLRHGGDAAGRLGRPAQARDRELARGAAAQRTFRAYAVEYLRTMLPTLQELLGAADAQKELGRVARLVGLQFHEETARDMDLPTDVERGDLQSARDFARWLSAILEAQGEDGRNVGAATAPSRVRQSGWRAVRLLRTP